MMRTQISITEEQAGRLKRFAATNNISRSEVVRRSLDMFLDDDERVRRVERACAVIGAYGSGCAFTATGHDSVMADIFSM